MCLIIFSNEAHETYRIALAANRDEFYARKTAPLDFWTDKPEVLAGRDLEGGGTWMGVTKTGRIAAVTNYREPWSRLKQALSRGALTADFLTGSASPEQYLQTVERDATKYNGFNLLVGDGTGLFHYSNKGGDIQKIEPGVHGLSNRLLDTPWPKVETGKARLKSLLRGGEIDLGDIFAFLEDEKRPPDRMLPDTGVGPEWERFLSPLFISGETYGTRSSSALLIKWSGEIVFAEKTFVQGKDGRTKTKTKKFVLQF